MKKFIVAVVYTGKSKSRVPSRWYKVEASSKEVAAKRALAKAIADNPRYSVYTTTVDTLTARKIKRFNREFDEFKDLMNWQSERRDACIKDLRKYIRRWLNYDINRKAKETGGLEWYRQEHLPHLRNRGLWYAKIFEKALSREANQWLQMLELRDVING